MTKDDIIRMAKEAEMPYNYRSGEINNLNPLERFASLVADAEREACAVMVENYALQYAEPVWALKITDAIRARSQS